MQWAGLFFIVWGLYALATSAAGPRGYQANFRSAVIAALVGHRGARVFFLALGGFLVVFGAMVLLGYIQPAEAGR